MLYLRRAKFRTRAIPQSVFDERFSTSSRQISHKPRANRYNASTRQRINAASNRSCRFIFRNASPLSSVRIESKPLGSSAVRIRMQIRRVCRRSLLRFNGRIKLIQIYIPEQDTHGRTHEKRKKRTREARSILDRLLPMATPPSCPESSVYTAWVWIYHSFLLERDIRTKGTAIPLPCRRREGGARVFRELRETPVEWHSWIWPCHDSPSPT